MRFAMLLMCLLIVLVVKKIFFITRAVCSHTCISCVWLEQELSNIPLLFSTGPRERIFQLLMAFSVRPALFCILLWLALSQEAAPEAKKGAKCKNPKVTWVLKDSISSSSLSGIWGRWVLQGLLQVHLCQNLKEIWNLGWESSNVSLF